jgi:hypothetical protein
MKSSTSRPAAWLFTTRKRTPTSQAMWRRSIGRKLVLPRGFNQRASSERTCQRRAQENADVLGRDVHPGMDGLLIERGCRGSMSFRNASLENLSTPARIIQRCWVQAC